MVAKLQPAVVNISTKQSITTKQQTNPFAGTPFEGFFGQFGGSRAAAAKREACRWVGLPDLARRLYRHQQPRHRAGRGGRVGRFDHRHPQRPQGYTAKVVGRDETSDLAVLKIDGKNLPFVRFGDSSRAVGRLGAGDRPALRLSSTVTAVSSRRYTASPDRAARTIASSRPTPRSTRAIPAARCST